MIGLDEVRADLETRRAARDRRDRTTAHTAGTCGGGDVVEACPQCHECERDEVAALTEWAERQPDPVAGEDPAAYWRRIGGPFGGSWYGVARSHIARRVA